MNNLFEILECLYGLYDTRNAKFEDKRIIVIMKLLIIKEDNDEVTMEYMEMINEASMNIGIPSEILDYKSAIEKSQKKDWFFAITSTTFCKLRFSGRKNVCLWLQGIVPEESYLRNNSLLRFKVLSFIEKTSLKQAKYILFVSKEMRKHVINKYNIKNISLNLIIPCFNTAINKDSFYDEKYNDNIFCYAGGMSVWQEFDNVLKSYSSIEKMGLKNCKLLLLVPNRELALKKIKEYGIQNYEIDYVLLTELNDRIKMAKFGFLFRKDILVNNVATPTKISTYLANGIIPIFSDALLPFYNVSKNMKYVIPIHKYEELNGKITNFLEIKSNDIWREYNVFFEKYYNRKHYIKRISDNLKMIMGVNKHN